MKQGNLDRETLAKTLIGSFPRSFMRLSRDEQNVSLRLYRLLAEGEPVPPRKIAGALHLSEDVINKILNDWPGVYYDDNGRVIGYWGLALPRMSHRFQVDGTTLYTWCAWDSLFLPELVHKTARVESVCPVTGDRIRLATAPRGVQEVEPVGVVMSFVAPEADKILENVLENFCHFVHFFSSEEAGEKWTAKHPGTFLLSLDDAYDLAHLKNETQYGDVLSGSTGQ